MPSKLAVLTDFDGTITRTDVAEAILEEFAPASWWDIEELHRARKIGTRESMAREFALLHAKQADLIRFVDDHVEMDDTFRDFAAFCQRRKIPLEIVSEGLDFYVRHLMRRWELRLPLRTNHAVFEEGSVRIEYPWADATCTLCGERLRERGRHPLFGTGRDAPERRRYDLDRPEHCRRLL